ncbi:MAG TPA: hypothetical protein VM582_02200, partial [Candidatus Thermoplasmatota archaeon]|nr:hypothetical protein [Candidatus Thermoplasmatota archaeon]
MVSARILGAALVLALALPLVAAQLPPTPLDPLVAAADQTRSRAREAALGAELAREDVDVSLDMEFRDVDFDTINVIFGGGRFVATARVTARIDMYVLSATRVQALVEGTVPGSGNVTGLAGAEGRFIPADAFRASLAGEAVAAFQAEQEERLARFLVETIPNVTVLSTSFRWANISPEDSYEGGSLPPSQPPRSLEALNDPRLPPITLVAVVDVQYLER